MIHTNSSATALVSCDWLADHLNDPDVRIIEVSANPENASYRAGHIPWPVWWFWKDALWHPTDRAFVTPEGLATRLGIIGISAQITVVIYGDPLQFGTYAFWVLLMAGHKNLRLLGGGRKRWRAEGRSLSQDTQDYSLGTADVSSRAGRDEVRAKPDQLERLLLDVRSAEEYRGERVSPPSGEVQFDFDHGAEQSAGYLGQSTASSGSWQ